MKQQDANAYKKILIRGVNWVGDAVISIPALKEIRRVFPDAHISLLVCPWVRDIYAAADFVDEILEYDRNVYRGFGGFFRLASELKKRQFDLAILLQNAFEAALLAWCARIPARVGYARDGRSIFLNHAIRIDPDVRKVHQAYYYLGILSSMKWIELHPWERSLSSLNIEVGIRDADRNAARELMQSGGIQEGQILIGINPGASYGKAKRWLPSRYACVADSLSEQYKARIVIFGALDDLPVAKEVAANMKQPALILAGRTTLGQLMGALKECSLLITNDSGPMHLAAALGVPQLAVFGSTSEVATGPISSQAVVIKHPVKCNPCFLRECPTDFQCMKAISAEEVVSAAQKILGFGRA